MAVTPQRDGHLSFTRVSQLHSTGVLTLLSVFHSEWDYQRPGHLKLAATGLANHFAADCSAKP